MGKPRRASGQGRESSRPFTLARSNVELSEGQRRHRTSGASALLARQPRADALALARSYRQTMYSLPFDLMIGEPLELRVTLSCCGAQFTPSLERCRAPSCTRHWPWSPPECWPAYVPPEPEEYVSAPLRCVTTPLGWNMTRSVRLVPLVLL